MLLNLMTKLVTKIEYGYARMHKNATLLSQALTMELYGLSLEIFLCLDKRFHSTQSTL